MKTSHSTLTIMINVHDDNNAQMTAVNVKNCRFEFQNKAVFAILSDKNSAQNGKYSLIVDRLAIRIVSACLVCVYYESKQLQWRI